MIDNKLPLTSDGLEWIDFVLSSKSDYVPQGRKNYVGGFGTVSMDKRITYKCYWVVSPRPDTRHGFVDKPVPISDYSVSLLEEMFSSW